MQGSEICCINLPDNLNVNKQINSSIHRNNNHWQKKLKNQKYF